MSAATKNEHDWHCEAHDTYGWRGEACSKCPVAPSEASTLRQQVANLTNENERLARAWSAMHAATATAIEREKELFEQLGCLRRQAEELIAERDEADRRVVREIEKLRQPLIDTTHFLERHSYRWDGVNGKHPNEVVEAARNALSSPDLSSPVLNSIPKEPTLPVFDADSPRFRQVFDEAVQAHNLPGKRKGEGYRSPITQWCFEIAYSVVNRLRLYEK